MMEEFLNIDTPENVGFDYEIAGIGSRFMAAAIDYLILGITQAIIVLGSIFLIIGSIETLLEGESPIGGIFIAVIFVVVFAINWGYFIFFEITWNGQTPGKKQIGLRTISLNGLPAGAGSIVIRNLLRTVDFLPISYGVGLVTMFINPQFRRLGDLAAGTVVVFDQTDINLDQVRRSTRTRGAPVIVSEAVLEMPLYRLDVRDIGRLEGYLARRDEMVNDLEVAQHILRGLYEKMDLEWNPSRFTMGIAATQLQEIHQQLTKMGEGE
ncbi:MAG: RDD family protein [Ardenticatenaceae bacterium]|nr:RDD family protein [Ardenticatenaceae bacterium]